MAIYKTSYSCYAGRYEPRWKRFLVLPRYAFRDVFQSRLFVAFFVACFLVPAVGAVLIYLRHNLSALELLDLRVDLLWSIDARFFLRILSLQGSLVFLMTAFVGPGLIAPDLANNALPLYLSRPFSKKEYVAGKMAVLLILQSLISWVPGLLLFSLQAGLDGFGWFTTHWNIAAAIFLSSWTWMLIVSLLSLALSAWVRWRPVAAALLVGIFFISHGFGSVVNGLFDTHWGTLLDLSALIRKVWLWLFFGSQGLPLTEWDPAIRLLPIWAAAASLAGVCVFSLFLLSRRVRAHEVVR